MSHDDLKSVGITAFGDRFHIISGLKKQNSRVEQATITTVEPISSSEVSPFAISSVSSQCSPVTLLGNQIRKSHELFWL